MVDCLLEKVVLIRMKSKMILLHRLDCFDRSRAWFDPLQCKCRMLTLEGPEYPTRLKGLPCKVANCCEKVCRGTCLSNEVDMFCCGR